MSGILYAATVMCLRDLSAMSQNSGANDTNQVPRQWPRQTPRQAHPPVTTCVQTEPPALRSGNNPQRRTAPLRKALRSAPFLRTRQQPMHRARFRAHWLGQHEGTMSSQPLRGTSAMVNLTVRVLSRVIDRSNPPMARKSPFGLHSIDLIPRPCPSSSK